MGCALIAPWTRQVSLFDKALKWAYDAISIVRQPLQVSNMGEILIMFSNCILDQYLVGTSIILLLYNNLYIMYNKLMINIILYILYIIYYLIFIYYYTCPTLLINMLLLWLSDYGLSAIANYYYIPIILFRLLLLFIIMLISRISSL